MSVRERLDSQPLLQKGAKVSGGSAHIRASGAWLHVLHEALIQETSLDPRLNPVGRALHGQAFPEPSGMASRSDACF